MWWQESMWSHLAISEKNKILSKCLKGTSGGSLEEFGNTSNVLFLTESESAYIYIVPTRLTYLFNSSP